MDVIRVCKQKFVMQELIYSKILDHPGDCQLKIQIQIIFFDLSLLTS